MKIVKCKCGAKVEVDDDAIGGTCHNCVNEELIELSKKAIASSKKRKSNIGNGVVVID